MYTIWHCVSYTSEFWDSLSVSPCRGKWCRRIEARRRTRSAGVWPGCACNGTSDCTKSTGKASGSCRQQELEQNTFRRQNYVQATTRFNFLKQNQHSSAHNVHCGRDTWANAQCMGLVCFVMPACTLKWPGAERFCVWWESDVQIARGHHLTDRPSDRE